MKSVYSSILIIFYSINIFCQDIIVDFSGTFQNNSIDLTSVLIENETQGTEILLEDNFVINLSNPSINSIAEFSENTSTSVYPNPFADKTNIEFLSNYSENVSISVINFMGQNIYYYEGIVFEGKNRISFSSRTSGFFIINVRSKNLNFSEKVFCIKGTENKLKINSISNTTKSQNTDILFYNIGDKLKFTGFYNEMKTVITASPEISNSYNFVFYECKDYEGNSYSTVEIGNQIWTAENIKSTKYSNGTTLINGNNAGNIENNFTAKYYFSYQNSENNSEIYGKLYTWAAAMNGSVSTNENPSNVQGICPNGWHLPSEAEWDELRDYLGGWEQMHGKVKSVGTEFWFSTNEDATNESGLSILPGGIRFDDGEFQYLGEQGFFWNTYGFNTDNSASGYTFFYILPSESYYMYTFNLFTYAQSVRCIKN